jgi:maltose phosphorylase
MKNYLKTDSWKIIEEGFHPEHNQVSESIFSLGNGRIGHRGNLEETYSGHSLLGNYIAGIYYPDKTKVGWWKNGYPEYFAKVLNSCNWVKLTLMINDEVVDLAKSEVLEFKRILDMQHGLLQRSAKIKLENGICLKIDSERFCSMSHPDIGALSYKLEIISAPNNSTLQLDSYLDFDIRNEDSNYEENFWQNYNTEEKEEIFFVSAETKKTNFHITTGNLSSCKQNETQLTGTYQNENKSSSKIQFTTTVTSGDEIQLTKYAAILSSMNVVADQQKENAYKQLREVQQLGYSKFVEEHRNKWLEKWKLSDIEIIGDDSAQQGIRFNIFHLHQTYTGDDARLNIGPKGFTGEKYGGSTYWDTEAYCIPFYLFTAPQEVARNLLIYRYKHLQKAIENAENLGFSGGAALYPMVTMNGEECHNEWEITFEEIHRNGAIAYAIYDYVNHTGDETYIHDYGIYVLLAIARFWAQRVNFSKAKNKYVMLGVTGPNEYENNVNNNWYTNYIAKWCLEYTKENITKLKNKSSEKYHELIEDYGLAGDELDKWDDIIDNIYLPKDDELGIFLQQDGFLDKEIIPVKDLDAIHRPINQKWSWDRILRSCYIKQADVLQGLYFFEDHFSTELLRKNFYYYEPLTVHESSLSPCVHSILACKLGDLDKAYEMYLRTARLDLDDYNNDTEDGLHITSMAGTWMAVVKGFGGVRIKNQILHIHPNIPASWQGINFKVFYMGSELNISILPNELILHNTGLNDKDLVVVGNKYTIKKQSELSIKI